MTFMKTALNIKTTAMGLSFLIIALAMGAPRLEAMMAPASAGSPSAANREADLQTVQNALEHKLIRQRLADLGLSRQEIDRRLQRLTDDQLHQAALQIEKQHPAGDTTVTILIVAGVLLVLALILAIARGGDDDDDDDDDKGTVIVK